MALVRVPLPERTFDGEAFLSLRAFRLTQDLASRFHRLAIVPTGAAAAARSGSPSGTRPSASTHARVTAGA